MPKASKLGVRGLYRDSTGRYRLDLRWRDPKSGRMQRHKERLPVGVPAAAAKRRAHEILAGALSGAFDRNREAERGLHELLDEYLKWAQTNRPRTYSDRRYHVIALKRALADVPLDAFAPLQVERFKRAQQEAKKAPATTNRILATLKHAVTYGAKELGWMSLRVFESIHSVKQFREPPGRVRFLAVEEEVRLFEHLPACLVMFVRTAMLTGMRLSEIRTLQRSQVDLSSRVITIGDKHETKTSRVRRIPMADALHAELSAHLKTHSEQSVFLDDRGLPFRSKNPICRRFAAAVRAAQIDNFHFHDLRHDFATRLRRGQVGIDAIAKLLGHSSITMAMRYAHIDDPTLRRAVAGLAAPAATEGCHVAPVVRLPATAG